MAAGQTQTWDAAPSGQPARDPEFIVIHWCLMNFPFLCPVKEL